jgi:hypothetical protein
MFKVISVYFIVNLHTGENNLGSHSVINDTQLSVISAMILYY